jgi:hypothetical protein
MLFLFEERGLHSFWMKNTLISLDILWLDSRGTIVSIAHGIPPCIDEPCPHYSPDAEACAVVEVMSGFAKQHDVNGGGQRETPGIDEPSPLSLNTVRGFDLRGSSPQTTLTIELRSEHSDAYCTCARARCAALGLP